MLITIEAIETVGGGGAGASPGMSPAIPTEHKPMVKTAANNAFLIGALLTEPADIAGIVAL